jgi:hypothetical protein
VPPIENSIAVNNNNNNNNTNCHIGHCTHTAESADVEVH